MPRAWMGIGCALCALSGCATQEPRPIASTDPTYGAASPHGAAAAPAGAPATPASGPSLLGTRWVSMADGLAENTRPRLEFVAQGRVSGYSGCNMLSGSWRMEGSEVRFGALATTKRMCLGPEGEVEQRLMAALGSGSIGRREGERLVLTGPGGAVFEFSPVLVMEQPQPIQPR
jgi:heat shock protein HslJ